jgi:hypothetical protein
MGPLMRRSGVIFLRRKLDDPLYKYVLRQFVGYIVQKRYTLSSHKKSTLRRDLEAWRGRPFTDSQADDFDIDMLIGAFNITEALAIMGKGYDWLDEIRQGQDALFELSRRGVANKMRFIMTARQWEALKLVMDLHEEQRLSNRLEMSTSRFKLNPVQYRLHTLRKMHELHSLHRELIDKLAVLSVDQKKVMLLRRADLFRIGKLLRISPSNESLRGEVDEIFKRQNRMRASVSRLLKRSVLLIANVEQGIFPSFKPIKPLERARFNKRQLEMHQSIDCFTSKPVTAVQNSC